MSGWSGKILRVDLSKREATTMLTIPYESFIGGRGINVKIIFDEVGPEVAPFDPENRLLLGPGILTGTPAPAASRTTITSLCPNGVIGSSGIGGSIGAEIRYAGYDNIIIQGKSDKPVYLYIHDDGVEFMDAGKVWGQETIETEQIIKKEVGDPDVQVVCIGPAGENLVSFASVRTEKFTTAGRGGMGAVIGSKNLKAIAIRGKGGIEIARTEEFLKLACEERGKLTESSYALQGPLERRIPNLNKTITQRGRVNFGNWEKVDWDEIDTSNFVRGGEEVFNKYYVAQAGCTGCSRACYAVLNDPETTIGTAKCASLTNLTFRVWNREWKVMVSAAHLCNNYGLDCVSTGCIIAFLMELYHRGIITEKDTDGIPMKRGDKEAIIATIHKLAFQEGFGKLFKDGVLAGARQIGRGAEEYAMSVKGQEMALREFRGRKGTALAQSVASKMGGGEYPPPETSWSGVTNSKMAVYPGSYENKALMVDESTQIYMVLDMLGICKNYTGWNFDRSRPYSSTTFLETPARLFSLSTGEDSNKDDLLTAAKRVRVLERAFDVIRGIRRKDDTLPKGMFETIVPGGPLKGERIEKDKFDKMVGEYYVLVGWDEDGVPKQETFKKYGLDSEWQTFEKRLYSGSG